MRVSFVLEGMHRYLIVVTIRSEINMRFRFLRRSNELNERFDIEKFIR